MAKLDAPEKKRTLGKLKRRLIKVEADFNSTSARAKVSLKNSINAMKPEDAPNSPNVDLRRLSIHDSSSLAKTVAELKATIKKVTETGEYGTCEGEDCGKEISTQRLKVQPTARLCLECQKGEDAKAKKDSIIAGMSGTRTGRSGPIY